MIVLSGNACPMIDSVTQSHVRGIAHDYDMRLSAAFRHGRYARQCPERLIVTTAKRPRSLRKYSMARLILPIPGNDLRIATSRCSARSDAAPVSPNEAQTERIWLSAPPQGRFIRAVAHSGGNLGESTV